MVYLLEQEIMAEIGFGAQPATFDESDYRTMWQNAADSIEMAIREHQKKGDDISSPDKNLLKTLRDIVHSVKGEYLLTYAKQAALAIIGIHVDYAHEDREKRERAYESLNLYLTARFLDPELNI